MLLLGNPKVYERASQEQKVHLGLKIKQALCNVYYLLVRASTIAAV